MLLFNGIIIDILSRAAEGWGKRSATIVSDTTAAMRTLEVFDATTTADRICDLRQTPPQR